MFFAALVLVMYLALSEGGLRRFGMSGGRRPQT
jgi:hypothetical protein